MKIGADRQPTCLIHAILALTANHIPESLLGSRSFFPIGTSANDVTHPEDDFEIKGPGSRALASGPLHIGNQYKGIKESPLARFQLWHRRKAFEGIAPYVDIGEKLIPCLQGEFD